MALADLIDEESKLFGTRPSPAAGRVDPARTMAAYADELSTLAPAQRAYAMAMLASGRPAIVTVPGSAVEGGLPIQRTLYPVTAEAGDNSAQPDPQALPPTMEQILERERGRAGRAPAAITSYAPNGAYAQSVQAMRAAAAGRARELAPTDPRRAGSGMSGFVEQLRGRR